MHDKLTFSCILTGRRIAYTCAHTCALTHLLTDILTHVHRQLSHHRKVSHSGKPIQKYLNGHPPRSRSGLKGTLTASGNAAGSGPPLLVAWDPPPLNSPPHLGSPSLPRATYTHMGASSRPPITPSQDNPERGPSHQASMGEGHLLSALETGF